MGSCLASSTQGIAFELEQRAEATRASRGLIAKAGKEYLIKGLKTMRKMLLEAGEKGITSVM